MTLQRKAAPPASRSGSRRGGGGSTTSPALPRSAGEGVLVLLVLGLILSGAPHVASADPQTVASQWGLPQLMAAMHAVRSRTAHFVERKFERMLTGPLESSGTLTFIAPDRLQKQTLAPASSRLTVVGDRLTMQQPDGKTRDVSLSEFPEIGALVASIRATLAGDTAALTRYYSATLTGDAGDWTLVLRPREQRLRDLLTMIRMRGQGNSIVGTDTVERDGDRTEMTITPDQE